MNAPALISAPYDTLSNSTSSEALGATLVSSKGNEGSFSRTHPCYDAPKLPMDLPLDLGTWTYAMVLDILKHHDYEPGRFDYKEALTPTTQAGDKAHDAHRHSIRKSACSMANTDGGFLIFGIKDRAAHISLLEDRIVGIPTDDDLARLFGDLVQRIKPELRFACSPKAIPLPSSPGRGLFVVGIGRSPVRPHELDGIFYRRGDGGQAIPMNAYEVRDQMLLNEALFNKLTLLRIVLNQIQSVGTIILGMAPDLCAYRFNTGAINPLLADTCILFPPGNEPLRRLSALVTLADVSNGLLDRINHETALGMQSLVSSPVMQQWKAEQNGCAQEIVRICRDTEAKLASLYGQVLP